MDTLREVLDNMQNTSDRGWGIVAFYSGTQLKLVLDHIVDLTAQVQAAEKRAGALEQQNENLVQQLTHLEKRSTGFHVRSMYTEHALAEAVERGAVLVARNGVLCGKQPDHGYYVREELDLPDLQPTFGHAYDIFYRKVAGSYTIRFPAPKPVEPEAVPETPTAQDYMDTARAEWLNLPTGGISEWAMYMMDAIETHLKETRRD